MSDHTATSFAATEDPQKAVQLVTLGPAGTFSDLVAQKLKQQLAPLAGAQLQYASSLPRCLQSILQGEQGSREGGPDYAVVPVENISEGFVGVVLDQLVGSHLHVVHEYYQAIEFSACGHVASTADAEVLFVQFVAEGQCRGFVEALGNIDIVTTASNSESLSRAQAYGRGALAIVPDHLLSAALMQEKQAQEKQAQVTQASQLTWWQSGVQDYAHNETRFWLLAKKAANQAGGKTSLVIMNEHDRPGLLEQVLHCFSSRSLNLTSIVSRPTGHKFGHCHFFIDVDAGLDHLAMQGAMKALGYFCQVQVLGCYNGG